MQVNASIPSIEFNPTARPLIELPAQKAEPVKAVVKAEAPNQEALKADKAENIQKLQDVLTENNVTLKFRQDSDTKQLVVELVDDKTGEAIRQIPSQISLKLAAVFVKMQGQFIDESN